MKAKFVFVVLMVYAMYSLYAVHTVHAVSDLGTFKKDDCITLYQYCPTCSYVNLTAIKYPNSTINYNIEMTKNLSNYYYDFCSTSAAGNYFYTVCGDKDGTHQCENINFEVTYVGTSFTTAQGILYIAFLVASILLFAMVFYGALKLPYKNRRNENNELIGINDVKYVKITCWALSYVIFMWIAGLLRGITANYIPEIGVDKMFNWVYWIMLSFMWPAIVCSLLFALILFINDRKMHKALLRGLPERF